MVGRKYKSGNKPKSRYYYEVQVLKWIIVWEWEITYWGKVHFDTRQKYLTAKHKLKQVIKERGDA